MRRILPLLSIVLLCACGGQSEEERLHQFLTTTSAGGQGVGTAEKPVVKIQDSVSFQQKGLEVSEAVVSEYSGYALDSLGTRDAAGSVSILVSLRGWTATDGMVSADSYASMKDPSGKIVWEGGLSEKRVIRVPLPMVEKTAFAFSLKGMDTTVAYYDCEFGCRDVVSGRRVSGTYRLYVRGRKGAAL